MNQELELQSKIEGLLFYKGEDMAIKTIATTLKVSEEDIKEALIRLETALSGRGLVLVKKDNSVMLAIAPELSSLIESIRKDEISHELSKASLETLSIILYKSGIARSEIDYIRGVNSSFIIRNLLIRGLIEKSVDPSDSRRALYSPTFETLSYMGVSMLEELPNYAIVTNQLANAINQNENEND